MTLSRPVRAKLVSMTILVNPYNSKVEWMAELRRLLPDERFVLWPDIDLESDAAAEIDLVVAWRMPRSALAKIVNLRAILSLGAGGDQWLVDGMPDVPIIRLVDPAMSDEMAAYALHWVLRLHRGFDLTEEWQKDRRWEPVVNRPADDYRIGILGYGTIGSRIGRAFSKLGYRINGWSRSPRTERGVNHFAGMARLNDFLINSDVVINVLPNTNETIKLLDASWFARFRPDAIFVNVGRGTVLDEAALVQALDNGPLRAAVLDVTDPEPPAPDSPLWTHPKVHLTPHIAGSTQVKSAARLIAANIARIRNDDPPFPFLDRSRGY